MCIDKDEILDLRARVIARKIFVNNIFIMVARVYLYVGDYKYERPGSLYNRIVVFEVAHGKNYKIQSVIEAIADSDQQDPIFLSRKETCDYVASVRSKNGVKKNIAAGILQVTIPDVTQPTYADTTGSEKMLYNNIQRLIIQGNTFNDKEKLSLISYMRQFNIRGKNETSKFDLYWKAA